MSIDSLNKFKANQVHKIYDNLNKGYSTLLNCWGEGEKHFREVHVELIGGKKEKPSLPMYMYECSKYYDQLSTTDKWLFKNNPIELALDWWTPIDEGNKILLCQKYGMIPMGRAIICGKTYRKNHLLNLFLKINTNERI